MAGHKIRKTIWVWVSVVILVIIGSGVTLAWFAGVWNEPIKPQPPLVPTEPAYAQELADTVNKYYAKYNEYPPYMLGAWSQELKSEDPLIAAGLLEEYPYPLSPSPGEGWETIPPERIRNMVSSPNDPLEKLLRERQLPFALRMAKLHEAGQYPISKAGRTILPSFSSRQVAEVATRKRLLCGGGDPRGGTAAYPEGTYSVLSFRDSVPETSSGGFPISLHLVTDQFGYQRGDAIEAIEGTPQEAWLWFYVDSMYETNVRNYWRMLDVWGNIGLDLIDLENGLIQPDGIADWIVVLYKLKQGEVAEVVKKYD